MVDRIVNIVPGEKLTAYKNVSINEPFFQGHIDAAPCLFDAVSILDELVVGVDQPAEEGNAEKQGDNDEFGAH